MPGAAQQCQPTRFGIRAESKTCKLTKDQSYLFLTRIPNIHINRAVQQCQPTRLEENVQSVLVFETQRRKQRRKRAKRFGIRDSEKKTCKLTKDQSYLFLTRIPNIHINRAAQQCQPTRFGIRDSERRTCKLTKDQSYLFLTRIPNIHINHFTQI